MTKSKLCRLSRTEMKLADIMEKRGRSGESLQWRACALRHYGKAFETSVEGRPQVDFDKLVPPIDR